MTDARLRILHVCSIKGRGGTGYMAGRICRLLHEAGHRVLVGTPAGSKMEERALEAGIPLLTGLRLLRGFRPVSLLNDIRRIRACIRSEQIQVVHAWHSIEYWTAAVATFGTRAKLFRTRGLVTPLRAHAFNKLVHKRTAAVFATCQKIVDVYRDAGLDPARVCLLRDSVDTERFHPVDLQQEMREQYGIPEQALVIASVGRLEPVKDQGTLLRAVSQVPQAHILIAGDGSQREALEALATQQELRDRVHFLGVCSDVERVLQCADVYVLCSTGSEGSSRATLEAMACALPCITTDVGMLPDIVHPDRTGLLFAPRDHNALAAHLVRLQNGPDLRRKLGQGALQHVLSTRTEAHMLAQIEAIYRQALGPS